MEWARSIYTNDVWNARNFQHASDELKALHRSNGNGFRCIECKGQAWFVIPFGNSPAKFAGHHPKGCAQGSNWMEAAPSDGTLPVRARVNRGAILHLRLDGLAPGQGTPPALRDPNVHEPGAGPARRHIAEANDAAGNRSVGLRALHVRVQKDHSYPMSADRITISGRGEARLRDAIHRATALPTTALSTHCLVWGTVTTVNHTGSTPLHWFMNVRKGSERVFALHMSAATADAVIASMNGRYGLRWATPFDARGAHFMALGHLRTAKNGVPMMFIKDTSHLALSVD